MRYHPPIKRSVEIAGHKTSITLEPVFWDLLRDRAEVLGIPINALVARIEADEPVGLASAIRQYLVEMLATGGEREGPPPMA